MTADLRPASPLLLRARRVAARAVSGMVPGGEAAQRVRAALWPHRLAPEATEPTVDRLAALRGVMAGRRCFVVGTAPSIDRLDLAKIGGHFVFLVNKGYLLADRLSRPPDALVIANPDAFAEYGTEAMALPFQRVFLAAGLAAGGVRAQPEVCVFQQYESPRMDEGFFQFDLARPLYHANTVALSAVQIAHAMGFAEICVIGVDLDFSTPEAHFYAGSEAERARSAAISRFTATRMREGFAQAQAAVAAAGRARLLNAGVGGRLDCLPRVPFDAVTGDAPAPPQSA